MQAAAGRGRRQSFHQRLRQLRRQQGLVGPPGSDEPRRAPLRRRGQQVDLRQA